ncbi:MAG: YkvA family protein [Candidatus Heimdallarchaeota archaeon]|nr:YkvA family protein [Candidatus Heimdallarchaeota archaeon]MDH5647898.1 YkvA family protein [Candidatus Heimdallarchaeota archaeon]
MFKRIYHAWKKWVKHWHGEIIFLKELIKEPDLPRFAKFLIFTLLSYIFSPIDVIPDFIPIFGHWDDFAAIPLTMWMIDKITPNEIVERVRIRLKDNPDIGLFDSWGTKIAAVSILIFWMWVSYMILKLMGYDHFG